MPDLVKKMFNPLKDKLNKQEIGDFVDNAFNKIKKTPPGKIKPNPAPTSITDGRELANKAREAFRVEQDLPKLNPKLPKGVETLDQIKVKSNPYSEVTKGLPNKKVAMPDYEPAKAGSGRVAAAEARASYNAGQIKSPKVPGLMEKITSKLKGLKDSEKVARVATKVEEAAPKAAPVVAAAENVAVQTAKQGLIRRGISAASTIGRVGAKIGVGALRGSLWTEAAMLTGELGKEIYNTVDARKHIEQQAGAAKKAGYTVTRPKFKLKDVAGLMFNPGYVPDSADVRIYKKGEK